jgi:hypothetical protein
MLKDQPKLAIKHLLSVVKPTQLKEVCENDLLLDQIELRTDFYGFAEHLRSDSYHYHREGHCCVKHAHVSRT